MTQSRGIRLTETRFRDLSERMAVIEARMDRHEQREDAGAMLAEQLGVVCLAVLKRHPRTPSRPAQPTKGAL